jgi:agmatinase
MIPFEWSTKTNKIEGPGVYLLGYEFDGTACFRKGTRFGPNAIRQVSDGIESYSPYLDRDIEDYQRLFDLGNLAISPSDPVEVQYQKANQAFDQLVEGIDLGKSSKLITLGGEHSISYRPIVQHLERFPDLTLLHLDAHADLRDGYEGYHYSHASIIRRCLDHFGPNHRLIQYGIRSGTKNEYQWMQQSGSLRKNFDDLLKELDQIQTPIYMTLDLDFFDPSIFPGTGTPEPGGENFHNFIRLIKLLDKKHFVGCDIVELSPPIDQTGNSSVFAAKVTRECILALLD